MTEPSSPAVISADPSRFHRREVTAAVAAATFFSSRPVLVMRRKEPSVQAIAKRSDACLPTEGNQCMSVTKVSGGREWRERWVGGSGGSGAGAERGGRVRSMGEC